MIVIVNSSNLFSLIELLFSQHRRSVRLPYLLETFWRLVQEMRRYFFIRLTHLVGSWDLNLLKLLFLGSLNQRDVLKIMRQIYIYGITKEVE